MTIYVKANALTEDRLQSVYEMDIIDANGRRLGEFPPTEEEALTISMLLAGSAQ